MRNQDRVVTRTMILEQLWDDATNPFSNLVDVHIKHLRDKVDRPFGRRLIRTVHGIGYTMDQDG